MTEALRQIEETIFKVSKLQIADLREEDECKEYYGVNFHIGSTTIKFRKAKLTPKKSGQFVTLWKRNTKRETEPFNVKDNFDFYIIATEQEKKFGFFLFPKHTLAKMRILTNQHKEGKRGFRVYPDWVIPESIQAEKTKSWQTLYFIDIANGGTKNIEKFNLIFNSKDRA